MSAWSTASISTNGSRVRAAKSGELNAGPAASSGSSATPTARPWSAISDRGAASRDDVRRVRARSVIGADGARSALAKQTIKGADKMPCVFAYHEIIRSPTNLEADFDGRRCDVFYQGHLSPDFYAWIFPHGDTASIGVGSARKGFSLKGAIKTLRPATGSGRLRDPAQGRRADPDEALEAMGQRPRHRAGGRRRRRGRPGFGRGHLLCHGRRPGRGGRRSDAFLNTGQVKALATARKRFMKANGTVFLMLGIMQHFWYRSDKRREGFVKMCADPDVQKLTWQAYMNKELVRADPAAHAKIFFKDMGHLLGLSPT